MERDISLVADHIPGKENTNSRLGVTSIQGPLGLETEPEVIQSNHHQKFGPLEIDLFASRVSTQLPRFFNWRPDPEAEATDAFNQFWEGMNYANPSMGDNSPSLVTGENAGGQPGPHSTSLEVAGVVPSTPVSHSGLPVSPTSRGVNDSPNPHSSTAHQGSEKFNWPHGLYQEIMRGKTTF